MSQDGISNFEMPTRATTVADYAEVVTEDYTIFLAVLTLFSSNLSIEVTPRELIFCSTKIVELRGNEKYELQLHTQLEQRKRRLYTTRPNRKMTKMHGL